MSLKKFWKYPLIFGIVAAFFGLLIRYAYTGAAIKINLKFALQAHSHVMLLGFLFNSLLILIWLNFIKKIDKISTILFFILQASIALMAIAFFFQGYALFSIIFSTIHLWASYILLIKFWKKLVGDPSAILLVKIGILFHFFSSLGPYALGVFLALHMKSTPWYQQAIFFYLHFQFLGVYFVWLMAILLKRTNTKINKKQILVLSTGLILLYTHSLDYSFNHWLLYFLGGLGSSMVFAMLLKFWNSFRKFDLNYRVIYYLVLAVTLINVLGSFPFFANLAIHNRFILIAWLHFLFLAFYVPSIWIFINKKIHLSLWILYAFFVISSELFLIFPQLFSSWLSFAINNLLFISYLGVFLTITTIHYNLLKK